MKVTYPRVPLSVLYCRPKDHCCCIYMYIQGECNEIKGLRCSVWGLRYLQVAVHRQDLDLLLSAECREGGGEEEEEKEAIYIWLEQLHLPCWGDYSVLDWCSLYSNHCKYSLNIPARDIGVPLILYSIRRSSKVASPSLPLLHLEDFRPFGSWVEEMEKHTNTVSQRGIHVLWASSVGQIISVRMYSLHIPPQKTIEPKSAQLKRKLLE